MHTSFILLILTFPQTGSSTRPPTMPTQSVSSQQSTNSPTQSTLPPIRSVAQPASTIPSTTPGNGTIRMTSGQSSANGTATLPRGTQTGGRQLTDNRGLAAPTQPTGGTTQSSSSGNTGSGITIPQNVPPLRRSTGTTHPTTQTGATNSNSSSGTQIQLPGSTLPSSRSQTQGYNVPSQPLNQQPTGQQAATGTTNLSQPSNATLPGNQIQTQQSTTSNASGTNQYQLPQGTRPTYPSNTGQSTSGTNGLQQTPVVRQPSYQNTYDPNQPIGRSTQTGAAQTGTGQTSTGQSGTNQAPIYQQDNSSTRSQYEQAQTRVSPTTTAPTRRMESQTLNQVRAATETAPATELQVRATDIVERALFEMSDGPLPLEGTGLHLSQVLTETANPRSRLATVQSYWRLCVAVADFRFAAEEARWLNTVPSPQSQQDLSILHAAVASAEARYREARLAVLNAQFELAETSPNLSTNELALPLDAPFIGRYQTHFDIYSARRVLPDELSKIDQSLPYLLDLVAARAQSTESCRIAFYESVNSFQTGANRVDSVLDAFQEIRNQRLALLAVVRDYNSLIADYAFAVGPATGTRQQVVAMLIDTNRNPQPEAPSGSNRLARQTSAYQSQTTGQRFVPAADTRPTMPAQTGGYPGNRTWNSVNR